MIALLSRKSEKGELALNLAKQLLQSDEWGRAKTEIESALSKGDLPDADAARALYHDICSRLSIKSEITRASTRVST